MSTAEEVNKHDTKDRFIVARKELEDCVKALNELPDDTTTILDAMLTASSQEDRRRLVDELKSNQNKKDALESRKEEAEGRLLSLKEELRNGDYFAKSKEIFPLLEATHLRLADIVGKSDVLYRDYQLTPYAPYMKKYREALNRHLSDECRSIPETESVAPSDASVVSASVTEVGTSRNRIQQHTVHDNKSAVGDAYACIIKGVEGHRGHQGPEGKTCAAWWAPIYLWLVGKTDELDDHLGRINNEPDEDEKRKLIDRLLEAFVMLAVGSSGKEKGMRDAYENILYVPNPHDPYYDNGCNWVPFPAMNLDEMLKWKGELYDVAFWAGDNRDAVKDSFKGTNEWKDKPSKYSAEEAEKAFLSQVSADDIKICSTHDLQNIAKAMSAIACGIADLHTRESQDNDYKLNIIDLAPAVSKYLTAAFSKNDPEIEQWIKELEIEKLSSGEERTAAMIAQMKEKNKGKKAEEITGYDNIKTGISELNGLLRAKGIHVPSEPTKNHFGVDGKHVFKTKIKQKFPTDPLIMAVKGLINLVRQWGLRLMPGFPGGDVDSSNGSNCGSSSGGSAAGNSAVTPVLVRADFVVVAPPEVAVGDDDLCSDISAEYASDLSAEFVVSDDDSCSNLSAI